MPLVHPEQIRLVVQLDLLRFCFVSLNGILAIKENNYGTQTQRRFQTRGSAYSTDKRSYTPGYSKVKHLNTKFAHRSSVQAALRPAISFHISMAVALNSR